MLLDRHWLGGHNSNTSKSVLKKLLWSRQLSSFKSFTLADAINTHLAGYPRTSGEERLTLVLIRFGDRQGWGRDSHTNAHQDALYRFQGRKNAFRNEANFTHSIQALATKLLCKVASLWNMLV